MPARASALADQAYATLRDAILRHDLPPKRRLSVPELARQLGISRSPVREAVARLAHEGLAEIEPHRGAVVADIRQIDLIEIYAIREVLEGLACRLASQRLTDDDLASLRELLANHQDAIASGDIEAHYQWDQRFHARIRQIAANSRLATSLDHLQGQIRIAMFTTHRSRGGMPQALAEHQLIVEALASRNADSAERVGRAHINRLLEDLESQSAIESQGSKP